MKNLMSVSTAVLMGAAIVIGGCKGSSKTPTPPGEKEVVVPCSGPDFFTTNKVFRANSIGESMDQSTSKKIAMTNARAELATAIKTTVKIVTDNYTNSTSVDKKEGLEQKFESLNREIVDQTLTGIKTICEKLVSTTKGNYKTYLAIELSADELVQQYNSRLSADEKLKVDYDYQKFKDTFNAEMDKLSKEKSGN